MRLLEPNYFASLFSGLCSIAATTIAAEEKMKIVASFSIRGDMLNKLLANMQASPLLLGLMLMHTFTNHLLQTRDQSQCGCNLCK